MIPDELAGLADEYDKARAAALAEDDPTTRFSRLVQLSGFLRDLSDQAATTARDDAVNGDEPVPDGGG